MKWICRILALMISSSAVFAVSPDEGLKLLKEGNERFVTDKLTNCEFSKERREATLEKQHPFAVVVTCSDSRATPEIIFDQSLGDIFVVRVAGNVITAVEQDSINYAVLHLKASLIVVLGHQSCGAVEAVLANQASDIPTVASWIKTGITPGGSSEEAIKENVRHGISVIQSAKALESYFKDNKLKIVGGYYSLKDGKVSFF